jgi:hypothetical protein
VVQLIAILDILRVNAEMQREAMEAQQREWQSQQQQPRKQMFH